ncbi:spore cortex biosynthesis protein YabQ [Haloimpatiens sp. FM7330]|uniref:spore cortex biosynthesis protein YabQ n=1 Tax=Haloimpatiens sp. FM7330 TaxID=3298610 RepID=UPI0036425980
MIISTSIQLKLLISNFLAGVLTGMLFDIYRLIRGINSNKFITFIEDILFWILAAILVFIFLFLTNYAYFGLYCYIYIAAGLILYLKMISKYFFYFMNGFISFIGKLIRVLANNISYIIGNIIYIFKKNEKKYKNNLNKK